MPFAVRRWPVALWLVAVVVGTYMPAWSADFVWDDDDYVVENPVLRSAHGLWQIWTEPRSLPQYYPLVHTTFWLEYRLFGLHPAGYHVTNILLHAASAVLLWRLLQRLAVPGALFAAFLFAVHPVHVESVAWVTERKNVLSLSFALLAAHAWLGYAAAPGPARGARIAVFYLLALLSKTVVAPLPAAMLLVSWWRNGRVSRAEWRAALPLLALGAAAGLFTAWLEREHVGAGAVLALTPAERVLIAGRALWFYAGSLLWPFTVCFNYPRWRLDTGSSLQWVFPVGALCLVLGAWLVRGRLGRGPLVALLCFGGMLVPALGFFDVYPFRYSFVADHFQYHASIALLALFGAGAAALAVRLRSRTPCRLLAGAIVAVLAVRSFTHCQGFDDFATMWLHTLACNEDSQLAHTNLGKLRLEQGNLAAAGDHLERALALDPNSNETLINLGVLAYRRGDRAAARARFAAARRVAPGNPSAHNNLAFLLTEEGKHSEALALVQEALRLQPDYYDAHVTASIALLGLRRYEECLRHADYVLQRTPDVLETRERACTALLALGRHAEALEHATILVLRQPEPAGARDRFAQALAGVLAGVPAAPAGERAAAACARVPALARELLAATAARLERDGRPAHAAAVRARNAR